MAKRNFLVPIAVTLSALASNAGAAIDSNSLSQSDISISQHHVSASSGLEAKRDLTSNPAELFEFVIKPSGSGDVFAGHRSHSSHRSHSAHRSHSSSR